MEQSVPWKQDTIDLAVDGLELGGAQVEGDGHHSSA
jgi:hypothetical protein